VAAPAALQGGERLRLAVDLAVGERLPPGEDEGRLWVRGQAGAEQGSDAEAIRALGQGHLLTLDWIT